MFKLILENIGKKYGDKKIIENLNLSVREGERVSILGPSGCGKSTLFKIASGIISDFEGRVLLDGKDISNCQINKRNIVIVNQENLLFPHMNVFENIAFGLRVRKVNSEYINNTVKNLLNEIGLNGYDNKKVSQLSGGEKQRVALARALAVKPEVLLLDEAYSSLDTNLREKMRELTIELQKKHNITMILVTHDKEEAILFSDRVAVMLNGEILQFDKPNLVYEKPKTLEVAKFMAEKNFIVLGENTVFIKVEDIITSKTIIEDSVYATVIDCKYSGSRNIYTVKIKALDFAKVMDKSFLEEFCNNKDKSQEDLIEISLEADKNTIYNLGEEIYIKIKKYNLY
ncbi:ABC-type Fe3+/spermidine/putrescine transport systems, ATPase components [Peptostreptococcus russellii]|uniref:ABC-type quaternary amine transporter n=3 Tax=Peptostreptococcus russellii TaxID=215200 RepID=A0A1H8EUI1_9FIRM|nr:ABC transporter ATP-binding protein [Peptostreptococcus russellii]SEN23143.1 ABC-type Fe3+/spermidine/putrescine transport systems, ATPase components [Peptostreptococcus russellii]